MDNRHTFRIIEIIAKGSLLLALAGSGGAVALVVWSMFNPGSPGLPRMDLNLEVDLLATVLNTGLPISLLAGGVLSGLAIRARAFRPFTVGLTLVALVSVFLCVLAAWNGLGAGLGIKADLWSRIWWKLTS